MPNPPKSDASWRELLTGQRDPEQANLAIRLVVGHLRQSVGFEPLSLNAPVSHYTSIKRFSDPSERAQITAPKSTRGSETRPFIVKNFLLTAKETSDLIETEIFIVIAGADEILASLPRGNSIEAPPLTS